MNDRREADGSELPWVCCAGGCATGVTITRHQSSGIWAVWGEKLNIRESTMEIWELRALRTSGKSPSGPARVKTVFNETKLLFC